MKNLMRYYATIARPSRLRLRGKSPVSLDHFIQRQRALSLWRDVIRSTASISNDSIKREMRDFARAEFARHRHETDLGQIRYLISSGKTQLDMMKSSMINSGMWS